MKAHYDFSKGRRGAVVAPTRSKSRITIRLDDDVLEWFRERVEEAGGGSYQTLINEALKAHTAQRREPLEDTVRRVVREELKGLGTPKRVARQKAVSA